MTSTPSARRTPDPGEDPKHKTVLVCSVDGKGIVMRPDALRPATAKAADTATTKLPPACPRARNATVNAWPKSAPSTTPHLCRAPPPTSSPTAANPTGPHRSRSTSGSPQASSTTQPPSSPRCSTRPTAATPTTRSLESHWWTATITKSTASTPKRQRAASTSPSSSTSSTCSNTCGKPPGASTTRPIPPPKPGYRDKATAILGGDAPAVAAGIRRRATRHRLANPNARPPTPAPTTSPPRPPTWTTPSAAASGWPIATGVIEGACRHLVKDRLDITGAHWGLTGAEAILKLRALHGNDDFDTYWQYHLDRERHRVHRTRYLDGQIPRAA